MEVVNIIGVIATVVGAFGTFFGIYLTSKNDDKPTFLFKGHSTFIQHNNYVGHEIDDYYYHHKSKKKRRKTTSNQTQKELIEYAIEASKLIKHLKRIALVVSVLFTLIYILLVVLKVKFIGTSHIEDVLTINNNLVVYVFIYTCLFLLIYSSIMLVVTAFYSREFNYQCDIVDYLNVVKLSQIKKILIKQFNFNNFHEFPVRALVRIINNIRISTRNHKAYSYNSRTKHTPRREILSTKSHIFSSLYFKIILLIIICNVLYLMFAPQSLNKIKAYASVALPVYDDSKVCTKRASLISGRNWKRGWKKKYANIFCDFTPINTPRGYYILNSPNSSDVYMSSNNRSITVSGYVQSVSHKYYFTKSSFNRKNPKFIYVP